MISSYQLFSARSLFFPGFPHHHDSDPSLPDETNGIQKAWIESFADRYYAPHNAEWAEAWFGLDALMHRTCHVASSVNKLRNTLTDSQISELMKPVIDAHRQWQERLIVVHANEIERIGELSKDTPTSPLDFIPILPPPLLISARKPRPIQFLDHSPIHITDSFFGSRLNNWRAIELYISLIQEPLWGKTSGKTFMDALDVCRTYAALGGENNFLGAETAIGLYLAGIAFGGPDMYSVISSDALLIERKNRNGF